MPSKDGLHHRYQHPMSERREVQIPWDLDLHDGNKDAALKAKMKFCTRIDAEGSHQSSSIRYTHYDHRSEEEDSLYDYFPELRYIGVEPDMERKNLWSGIWDSSKVLVDEALEEIPADTTITNRNGNVNNVVGETSVGGDDDDLYCLTPPAIVENNKGEDDNLEVILMEVPLVEQRPAVIETPTALKNSIAHEQTNGNKENSTSAIREFVNVPDGSTLFSGTRPSLRSDAEYTEDAIAPIRHELLPKLAHDKNRRPRQDSRAECKEIGEFDADPELPHIGRIAETPKNGLRNGGVITRYDDYADIDMATATEITTRYIHIYEGNTGQPILASHAASLDLPLIDKDHTAPQSVHLLRWELLPVIPTSPSTSIPATLRIKSPQVQTSEAQHVGPLERSRSRDPDTTVILSTEQTTPYLTCKHSISQPAGETLAYNRHSSSIGVQRLRPEGRNR
jgi:hypothetical protein